MIEITRILTDGAVLSVLASVFIAVTMRLNPRIWLQDYPPDVQARVPPKTEKERRQSLLLGVPFLLLLVAGPVVSTLAWENRMGGEIGFFSLALHAFGVVFVFNLVDLLVLDWLVFCALTPDFVVIPGSEGAEGYQDYGFHFRGFLIGTALSAVTGLIVGAVVWAL